MSNDGEYPDKNARLEAHDYRCQAFQPLVNVNIFESRLKKKGRDSKKFG